MDRLSIKQIEEQYKAASVSMLPSFIEAFAPDERSQVQMILKRARKKIADHEKEVNRTHVMYTYERKYADYRYICGIDEVGRGPLAGPVVTCAVILPKDEEILELNDSKQLSAAKREELFYVIMEKAVAVSLGFNSEKRIDEINILNATLEAMRDSVLKMSVTPDLLLNDAVRIPGLDIPQVPIIKGDAKSASIAAASIVAKVTRDRLMVEMDEKYPGYDFASNKGYGSQAHIDALKKLGPCEIHRRSFIGHFL